MSMKIKDVCQEAVLMFGLTKVVDVCEFYSWLSRCENDDETWDFLRDTKFSLLVTYPKDGDSFYSFPTALVNNEDSEDDFRFAAKRKNFEELRLDASGIYNLETYEDYERGASVGICFSMIWNSDSKINEHSWLTLDEILQKISDNMWQPQQREIADKIVQLMIRMPKVMMEKHV